MDFIRCVHRPTEGKYGLIPRLNKITMHSPGLPILVGLIVNSDTITKAALIIFSRLVPAETFNNLLFLKNTNSTSSLERLKFYSQICLR